MATDAHATQGILLLGHSYIRRLGEFINKSRDPLVQTDFALLALFPQDFSIRFEGIGGAHLPRILNTASKIIPESPVPISIAVLQAGDNDIDRYTESRQLANTFLAAAEFLHVGLDVKQVVLSQLSSRDRVNRLDYNDDCSFIKSLDT